MSDKDQVLEQVRKVIAETFKLNLEDVTPEKDLFNDLDLDSLDAVDLASALTTKEGIKFSNDVLREIHTVDDVVQSVLKMKSENG